MPKVSRLPMIDNPKDAIAEGKKNGLVLNCITGFASCKKPKSLKSEVERKGNSYPFVKTRRLLKLNSDTY